MQFGDIALLEHEAMSSKFHFKTERACTSILAMTRAPRRKATKTQHPTSGERSPEGGTAPYGVPTDPMAPVDNTGAHVVGGPVFSQPEATVDPTEFRVRHPSDAEAYKTLDELNARHALQPLPFPPPRGLPEPVLTLAHVLGPDGPRHVAAATKAGRLVFHTVGDTGNTRGPDPQNLVADKMVSDFDEADAADRPLFYFHLGDVIYNFGEAAYYYDQFYDPYRNYPGPIVALAGNHDGMIAPGSSTPTLAAFLANFCADDFRIAAQAGGLSRTAQVQPGVFFTFEAPFVRILALYSNTLEDPGVISSQDGTFPELGDSQIDYLKAALARVSSEGFKEALIIAHHHPAYTAGSKHGWSSAMLAQIDAVCEQAGVWPHAVLSAHAHNYQRFTRLRHGTEIPYMIAGGGGHGLAKLTRKATGPLRTPIVIQEAKGGQDHVVLENYDDQDYGYLRVIATATQLRIEYHPASDGATAKTPDDSVTIDLATRTVTRFSA